MNSGSSVYACPSGIDALKKASFLGYMAQKAQQMVVEEKNITKQTLENISKEMEKSFLPDYVNDQMVGAKLLKFHFQEQLLEISLSSPADLIKDLPVYLALGAAVTDALYTPTVWFNMSAPFAPIGFIKEIFNGTHASMNVTNPQCFFHLNTSVFPALQVPKNKDATLVKFIFRKTFLAFALQKLNYSIYEHNIYKYTKAASQNKSKIGAINKSKLV